MNPSTEFLFEEVKKQADLKHYLHLFQKNKTPMLLFFVVAMIVGASYVSKIPDTYEASAEIMLGKPVLPVSRQETSEDIEAQMKLMKNDAVLLQAVRDLKLADYYAVETDKQAMEQIRNLITVTRSSNTSRIFVFNVNSLDPQFSANLANALVRGYIRVSFENSIYQSKDVLNSLLQQESSERVLPTKGLEATIQSMTPQELMDSLPAFQENKLLQELREKKVNFESEVRELAKQYREKHPLMIKAQVNLKSIETLIDSEKRRVLETFKSEGKNSKIIYNARIVEDAEVPGVPLPAKRFRTLFMIGLLELFVSFLVVILMDFFDLTIKSTDDLERKGIAVPFLGYIPVLKKKKVWGKENLLITYDKEMPEISEALRYIRVAINFSGTPESLKVLMFSSCLPREGKTFSAQNTAISLAMDGNKTLLIDADLRCPNLHKKFKVDNQIGLSSYLTSDIGFESVMKATFIDNLFLVPSGPSVPNPLEALASKKMGQFLEEAKKYYDRIVIDGAALSGAADGIAVGKWVGQLILIVLSGKTTAEMIKKTRKQVEASGIKILGIILNRMDPRGGDLNVYHPSDLEASRIPLDGRKAQ